MARPAPAPVALNRDALIVIGASTGGTEALKLVLSHMPAGSPPILVVQHIPPVFSRALAERLNKGCALEVKEAADGDAVIPGQVLIAPGDFHMTYRTNGGRRAVAVVSGPRIGYQRPSVDVLFESVVSSKAKRVIGVLLTGMGTDGANGLLSLKRTGAYTIAQNEATCVVYGMPREAARLGAASAILPLEDIAQAIIEAASHRKLEKTQAC